MIYVNETRELKKLSGIPKDEAKRVSEEKPAEIKPKRKPRPKKEA